VGEIVRYEGRVALPPDIQRFVVYVNGSPALMIELYTNHYHVYGPRAGKVSDTLQAARDATKLLNLSDERTRYAFELSTTRGWLFFVQGSPAEARSSVLA